MSPVIFTCASALPWVLPLWSAERINWSGTLRAAWLLCDGTGCWPCDCHVSLWTEINSLKDTPDKCLMETWFFFNHSSTTFVLSSVQSAPLCWAGRGCWVSSWTIEPAVRQAEGGTKHPTIPSPLPYEDGTNGLYKRQQRKVLLRVPVTKESLGGRLRDRKVMSVITAGCSCR